MTEVMTCKVGEHRGDMIYFTVYTIRLRASRPGRDMVMALSRPGISDERSVTIPIFLPSINLRMFKGRGTEDGMSPLRDEETAGPA